MFFIFKGKKSTEMGVEISEYTNITRPQKNTEQITIPGRDGVLYRDIDSYNSYQLTFSCIINKLNKNININKILEWLSGSGDLIISLDKTKKYKARITNNIPISDVIWIFPEFQVIFEVQPFKYNVNILNDEMIFYNDDKEIKINNKGNYKSLPIIDIYGNGNVDLFINEEMYSLINIENKITINSEIMEVYKDKENQNNKYKSFEFPQFNIGINTISFNENVNKIVINPNWRWL